MPLYEDFMLPSSQRISSFVGTPIRALQSIAADYMPKYEEALEAENNLVYALGDAYNTIRDADRTFLDSKIAEYQAKLDNLASQVGKGFTTQKINRYAKEFASWLVPLQKAKVMEDQEISALAQLNLTPQQRALREKYIKGKQSITQSEDGTFRFDYSPTLFRDQPNWQEEVDKIARGIMPGTDKSWSDVGVYVTDAQGFPTDMVTRERIPNAKSTGIPNAPVQISDAGSVTELTSQRLRDVISQGLMSNTDVASFIAQEAMVTGLSPEELLDQYITPALEYGANKYNYRSSKQGGGVDIINSLLGKSVKEDSFNRGAAVLPPISKEKFTEEEALGFKIKDVIPLTRVGITKKQLDIKRDLAVKQYQLDWEKKNRNNPKLISMLERHIEELTAKAGEIESSVINKAKDILRANGHLFGYDFTNKDIDFNDKVAQDALKEYAEWKRENIPLIQVIPFTREGEEGRALREDVLNDVISNPSWFIWYDRKAGKVVDAEDISTKNIVASGEISPENYLTKRTGIEDFSNGIVFTKFNESGKETDSYVVTRKQSDQNDPRGQWNKAINQAYIQIMDNPNISVDIAEGVKAKLIVDNSETGSPEIVGIVASVNGEVIKDHLGNPVGFQNVIDLFNYLQNAGR